MHLQKSTWMLIVALGCISACGDDENKNATVIDPIFGAACALVTCPETAECVVLGSGQTDCQCQIGYQGDTCDRCESGYHRDSKDRCVPDKTCEEQDPCAPNGICSDKTGVIECKCAARYAGPRCTVCAPPYRPGADGDCVATPANDAALEDAGMDAGDVDATVADSAVLDTGTAIDSSVPVVDSSVPIVDSSVPVVDSSVPVVDSSVPVIDSGVPVVDSSVPIIDSSVPVVDSSVPDASVCTTQVFKQDFESMPNWPSAINTCSGTGDLTAGTVVLRSRQGDAPARRCAPSTFNQLTTRHAEVASRLNRPAEITFNQPASFVSFSAGALTTDVSVEIRANGKLYRTLTLPANSSQLVTLSLDAPATTISLNNLTNFTQFVCLDNIEHHTKTCQ